MEKAPVYREVASIHRSRIVVVGEVRDGHAFAYDEAVSVIRRIAAARAAKTSNTSFKELPPIRRNVTAFCMTSVSFIAMSPITLLLFVGHDQIASFLHKFGPARTPRILDKQLRQQREWARYKNELLQAAADRTPTRLQMVMGRRRLPQTVGVSADAKVGMARRGGGGDGDGGGGSSRSFANGDSSDKKSLLEGLGDVVNGAASAELAAASSEMGTAIMETFRQINYLEPAASARQPASARPPPSRQPVPPTKPRPKSALAAMPVEG